jgi:hypothetical protein
VFPSVPRSIFLAAPAATLPPTARAELRLMSREGHAAAAKDSNEKCDNCFPAT